MFTQYTVEEAGTRWGPGAPDDGTLAQLLAVSWAQCVAYAPLPAVPDLADLFESALTGDETVEAIPVGHREAHYQQARNIWNASTKSPSGDFGPDGMTIAFHPLDWHVKQLLRPRRAVPKVG